jgi:predicted ATPase
MQRYILTGAPGSGKTAILRKLEMEGFCVVEEAATDLIALRQAEGVAEPWMQPGFVEEVSRLQQRRLAVASQARRTVQFHDRSLFCTIALADYLKIPRSEALLGDAAQIRELAIYQNQVFFIRNLGFIEPTAARRITFEETIRFERIHEDVYREWGFELIYIETGSLADRVGTIRASIERSAR